jgi:hypothetical protein
MKSQRESRYRCFYLPQEFLMVLLGAARRFEYVDWPTTGFLLPPDADIDCAYFDSSRRCIAVIVWSSHFPIVPCGQMIPEGDSEFRDERIIFRKIQETHRQASGLEYVPPPDAVKPGDPWTYSDGSKGEVTTVIDNAVFVRPLDDRDVEGASESAANGVDPRHRPMDVQRIRELGEQETAIQKAAAVSREENTESWRDRPSQL